MASQNNFKPGPDNQGFTLIAPSTGGGGTAVEIVSLTNPGTSGVLATVRELDASGITTTFGYNDVYVLPYGQFAEPGDNGIMATFTPTSGLSAEVRYIHISKSAFLKF